VALVSCRLARARVGASRSCSGDRTLHKIGLHKSGHPMEGIPRYLVMAAVAAVFVVLLAGLWNMMRGTSPNLSQTLMRWRVGLQFLAIVLMMILLYLWRS
jgi:hypothetical protein